MNAYVMVMEFCNDCQRYHGAGMCPNETRWLDNQKTTMDPKTIPNDKAGADLWIESIKAKADVEKRRITIRGWIVPLRMLIQAGKNELPPDTMGGANLDVAQQVITEIEKANEG